MSNPRAEYSPIFQRKPLKLPGNARLAVFTVVNVEEWDINAQMARSVIPAPPGRHGDTGHRQLQLVRLRAQGRLLEDEACPGQARHPGDP